MNLNTDHYARCIRTLEASLSHLESAEAESIEFEVFRNALKLYTGRPRDVDARTYKDLLRHAGKHDLMTPETVTRWFIYRDNRNNTVHDYGVGFAEETLTLLPLFVADARTLEANLREKLGNGHA